MIEEDEFVDVKLLKSEAQILKQLIKEREAYNFVVNKIKTTWVWVVAGGLVTIWVLWDKIHALLIGVK